MDYGWAGKILELNLSTGKHWTYPTKNYARQFIGGRGINVRILFEKLEQNTDAFDPNNPLMIFFGKLPLPLIFHFYSKD